MKLNFLKKKQKWQNLTIFWKFPQQKGVKNDNCVLILRFMAGNGEKISKKFLVYVLDKLYMNRLQILGKKTKMTKFNDFWKISPKFTNAWKQKRVKMTIVFWPSDYCQKMAKKTQNNFWCMFQIHFTWIETNLIKKKQKWQNLTIFWKFLPKQNFLVVKNRVFWQKKFFWNFCKSVRNRQNKKKLKK